MSWVQKLFYKRKNVDEVRIWLADALREQAAEDKRSKEEFERRLSDVMVDWKRFLDALESAQLHNPDIPERARHFMEGNRTQFMILSSRAMADLSAKDAPADIRAILNRYANDTARCKTILSEFFRSEVRAVLSCASTIEVAYGEFINSRDKAGGLTNMSVIIGDLDALEKESELRAQAFSKLKDSEARVRANLDVARQRKEAILSSEEYLDVKERLMAAAKERIAAADEIVVLFSPVMDAIQKYVHEKNDVKIAKYVRDPLDALIHDYALSIVERAPLIRESIQSGEIVLSDEKRSKALAALPLLAKDTLSRLIHRYANARKLESEAQALASSKPVMNELEQGIGEVNFLKHEREKCELEMARCAPPNIGAKRQELEKALEAFKIELT